MGHDGIVLDHVQLAFGLESQHMTGWWFQTFFVFIPICGRFPF